MQFVARDGSAIGEMDLVLRLCCLGAAMTAKQEKIAEIEFVNQNDVQLDELDEKSEINDLSLSDKSVQCNFPYQGSKETFSKELEPLSAKECAKELAALCYPQFSFGSTFERPLLLQLAPNKKKEDLSFVNPAPDIACGYGPQTETVQESACDEKPVIFTSKSMRIPQNKHLPKNKTKKVTKNRAKAKKDHLHKQENNNSETQSFELEAEKPTQSMDNKRREIDRDSLPRSMFHHRPPKDWLCLEANHAMASSSAAKNFRDSSIECPPILFFHNTRMIGTSSFIFVYFCLFILSFL